MPMTSCSSQTPTSELEMENEMPKEWDFSWTGKKRRVSGLQQWRDPQHWGRLDQGLYLSLPDGPQGQKGNMTKKWDCGSKLVFWEPMHGKGTRGAQRITTADELLDRDVWRGVISRARVAPVIMMMMNGLGHPSCLAITGAWNAALLNG